MTQPQNLPALVQAQGGAVVEVLSWPHHLEALDRKQQLEISLLVQTYPGLATESSVDLLAEASGYFGERLDRWFASMVDLHGIEMVYAAIETLDVLGLRHSPNDNAPRNRETERFDLDEMLGLMTTLEEVGRTVESADTLQLFIDRLGGWEVARLLDARLVRGLLDGDLELSEARELVDAPEIDQSHPQPEEDIDD